MTMLNHNNSLWLLAMFYTHHQTSGIQANQPLFSSTNHQAIKDRNLLSPVFKSISKYRTGQSISFPNVTIRIVEVLNTLSAKVSVFPLVQYVPVLVKYRVPFRIYRYKLFFTYINNITHQHTI